MSPMPALLIPLKHVPAPQGKDAIPWIEKLVVGDIAGLKDGTGTLSVLTNESGGIIDDTIVTRIAEDELYLVLNAGCRDKDLAHLRKHLDDFSGDLTLEVMDDKSLLALQGPQAVDVLQVRMGLRGWVVD